MSENTFAPDAHGAVTHEVQNQSLELRDYNLFTSDRALMEAVRREGADDARDDLERFGAIVGAGEYLELGHLANKHQPEFESHDRYGHRVDLVRFHPSYHHLMKTSVSEGIHSAPWASPTKGAHAARAAKFYLHSQVEAGHGCPITMTFAAVPALRNEPALADRWMPKMLSRDYDPRNVPAQQKRGITIGMAITEKQGGSDVGAITTRAIPIGRDGSLELYELVGHKYFVSAPMSDAFLVLAQAPGGLSCFLLPRWRPDGTKNPMQLQRLKKKMGNVSNASSETELRGALAYRVGAEGRGVETMVEMVAMTRFDCTIGSAAGMRMATSQAIDHCRHRSAFGAKLVEKPLMQNVLADLALEAEAALAFSMRLARAFDDRASVHESRLFRIGTAIGKYWICKRAPAHAYEAMECLGGSGVVEDSPMPRLYRETPGNAIWEGSSNVRCLDVLRTLAKSPDVLDAHFAEVSEARRGNVSLDRHLRELEDDVRDGDDLEYRARDLVDRMATGFQAALLVRHAPAAVSDAFCSSRLDTRGQRSFGSLPRGVDARAIVARAMPRG